MTGLTVRVATYHLFSGILSAWYLALGLSVMSMSVLADSPVWKISDGDNPLFLGGTIHILSDADYLLPAAFERAYDSAEAVILEADLSEFKDPTKLPFLMSKAMYTDGRNLGTVLSPEIYQQLEDYGAAIGLPITFLKNLKPGMVTVMLMTVELQKRGLFGVGVDEYFGSKPIADQKPLSYLESIEQQLEIIARLGEESEDDFISFNLQEMKNLESIMANMKKAWRSGDLDTLEKLSIDNLRQISPEDFDRLVVQRNNNGLPKIEAAVKSPGTELVLVGALHLVGGGRIDSSAGKSGICCAAVVELRILAVC